MPRRPKNRWVQCLPRVNNFKPAGIPLSELEEITLSVEELEAIRLKDLEGLEQTECALRMGISRPTFHRILVSARQKIAESLVMGKALRIEGGDFKIYSRKFLCQECRHEWQAPSENEQYDYGNDARCPVCGKEDVLPIDQIDQREQGLGGPPWNHMGRGRKKGWCGPPNK
ncbi:MAG: hypothetical protein XD50_1646 [Clostridia bacterium 41_269]|nr:MAG: hypothetical protein XD50_1646 [Clostridia bacterium 41_269]